MGRYRIPDILILLLCRGAGQSFFAVPNPLRSQLGDRLAGRELHRFVHDFK